MLKTINTAEAHVTGGRANGRGRTSDGQLDLTLRPPVELGGRADGTNPEQLLAIGWAACFEATLATAAHRNRLSMKDAADAEIDSRVKLLLPADEATPADFELGVEFDVRLPSVADAELATEPVRTAHQLCLLFQGHSRQHRRSWSPLMLRGDKVRRPPIMRWLLRRRL